MTPRPHDHDPSSLVNADDFLAFAERLRRLRDVVEAADVSDGQRRRWQSRMAAISGGDATDLARAATQLGRLEAEVERVLRR